MIHAKRLCEQPILRFHHVAVTVMWEFSMHAVARFARFAVADSVRQYDKKLRRIEWLNFPEKFVRKFRAEKLRAAASGPVHNENRIRGLALRILLRFPQRPIMDMQLRQC